ncbi:MAG: hypothetical protein JWO34_301 [Arthrobacter sp.]|jgi:hypothetical protein|nr:hypothetical protein [Arthrobacter sp.]
MSAKALTDQLIDALLNGRYAENVSKALFLLEEADRIPAGTDLKNFRNVASWETWYGSTAGPFPGVGGAAMTWFRMRILHSDTALLLFAGTQFGDQFYGAAPFDAAILAAPKVEDFDLVTAHAELNPHPEAKTWASAMPPL